MHVKARSKVLFVLSNELHGISVTARKCLLGKTHVKSVNKATAALLPKNYNAKQKPGGKLLYNFLSSPWPHGNLTGV